MNILEIDGPTRPTSLFASLGLAAPLLRAVADESYSEPTPVQSAVVPHVVAGRDVLACAQTGTGKTAAFVLPILHRLAASDAPRDAIHALVLTPTRELAAQIAERVSAYGRYLDLPHAVIYGGVSQYRQEVALRKRPRLLIATPGRLLDLMNQGLVRLDRVSYFVLDEADRMLDMGFINDVRRVARALPARRQTLLFSATVPKPIEALAESLLVDPVRVNVTPKVTAAETVEQAVVFVARDQKAALLERFLMQTEVERAIVFTRTKHGANRLSQRLERFGIAAPAIHGNKSQSARERALAGFRAGKTRVLIATDIAARGIDVDGISHVVNFDLPNVPESYVHRIGRTGRAGASGKAVSFCDRDEQGLLRDIERVLRQRLAVVDAAAFEGSAANPPVPFEPSLRPHLEPHREPRPAPQRHGAERDPRRDMRHRDTRPSDPRRDARPSDPRRDARPSDPRRDARPSDPRRDTRHAEARPNGRPDARPNGRPDARPNGHPSGRPDGHAERSFGRRTRRWGRSRPN